MPALGGVLARSCAKHTSLAASLPSLTYELTGGSAPMSLDDPVVITCSISGAIANREQCPAIPYTPEEYAAEARRIVDEGGVMIHIPARKPAGSPSSEDDD